MKKIILLEDKPEKLKPVVQKIKEQCKAECEVLFYCDDVEQDNSRIKRALGLDNVVNVDFWDLRLKLDALYSDKDNIFIFDTQLDQKNWEDFDYMINVNYALGKQKDHRIWFYTVAGPYFKDNIQERFPTHVLNAKVQDNGDVDLELMENECFRKTVMGQ